MKKFSLKSIGIAVFAMAISVPALANTVHTFSYDGGKKAEIYVSSSSSDVFVKTSVNNWDTKFKKGSGYQGCDYKKGGSCYTTSQMIAEVESKTRSGEYWK